MRCTILVPLMLAPLAGACTPDSAASPDVANEPASAADRYGSSSALPVAQIQQIVGARGDVTTPSSDRSDEVRPRR